MDVLADSLDDVMNILYFLAEGEQQVLPVYRPARKRVENERPQKKWTTKEVDDLLLPVDPKTLYGEFESIARGGFGEVFMAHRQSRDGDAVAIKALESRGNNHHTLAEIETLRKLSHPCIVTFHEAYIFDDMIYVVMDFCDGGTLTSLTREVDLNLLEVAHFARQVCEGLGYLHSKKLIHRDLKSENILLNLNGHIHIADFGLIADVQSPKSLHHYRMVGTPYFMAPELIRQQRYGLSVDIWGLGCIVYELFAALPPRHGRGRTLAMWETVHYGGTSIPAEQKLDDRDVHYIGHMNSFLDFCFQLEPTFRPSAREMLSHPFLNLDLPGKSLDEKMEIVFLGASLRESGLLFM
eukprot:TRINITY_DN5283_c0_g1_i1.p1 TRINITY_DN5283_c0_g1~~TRINITY_DN5283_c0_g1_i1.p1  ORF type:complete len:397 (+),score=65.51 TRINITY_DN5283_c0_g1_i1:137-1192(+)